MVYPCFAFSNFYQVFFVCRKHYAAFEIIMNIFFFNVSEYLQICVSSFYLDAPSSANLSKSPLLDQSTSEQQCQHIVLGCWHWRLHWVASLRELTHEKLSQGINQRQILP